MTSGERRFSERIVKSLGDEVLAWFDAPVGPKGFRPDFLVLDPRRGLWILEVRDWLIGTIREADRQRCRIVADGGLKLVPNPLEQARIQALEVDVLLRRDPSLRHPDHHPQAGKLILPWGYGVVLANITRAQFQAAQLERFLVPHLVICKDEATPDTPPAALEQRLRGMLAHEGPCTIAPGQLDRIRAHLFPQVRVNDGTNRFGLFDPAERPLAAERSRVMDLTQEWLARSASDGHCVIHGVAGSGKTLILVARCVQLAREAVGPILVLCYNVALAARLREVLERQGVADRVTVLPFFDWCGRMLVAHGIAMPRPDEGPATYVAELVGRVAEGLESGRIPPGRCAAVMIDEAHELQPDWLRLALRMVDPATRNLLVLYDEAQSPAGRERLGFAEIGIEARGRTTLLKLNYRNAREIHLVARRFADHLLMDRFTDEDHAPVIDPEPGGRPGDLPVLVRARSAADEAKLVADRIVEARERGVGLSDIGILYRRESQAAEIRAELARRGIAHVVGDSSDAKRVLFAGDPAVKLLTIQGAKGLEFRLVVIPRLCEWPGAEADDEEAEARLLYVGMTRATEHLLMTRVGESRFGQRIDRAIRVADAALLLTAP